MFCKLNHFLQNVCDYPCIDDVITHVLTRGHLNSCYGDSTQMSSSVAKTNRFNQYKPKKTYKKHSFLNQEPRTIM